MRLCSHRPIRVTRIPTPPHPRFCSILGGKTRQRGKGTAISHIREPWWLWVLYRTRTHLASPTTAAEFRINTSTHLHLLQELSRLSLLNYLPQCKGRDFYLFYSFSFLLCSSSHPTAFSLARCPELHDHGQELAPGKEMLKSRGWDKALLWSVGIYLENCPLMRATK